MNARKQTTETVTRRTRYQTPAVKDVEKARFALTPSRGVLALGSNPLGKVGLPYRNVTNNHDTKRRHKMERIRP
jgi:hypothetical protein